MRRIVSCVLMMTLLLTGCGKNGAESPENLAARIRGEYLGLAGWKGNMDVTVEYEDRFFDFSLAVSWEREGETVLTITAPELVAGISARIVDGEGYLTYDGASLSTGPITGEGLTPMEAVPILMEQVTTGYMARCTLADGVLTVLCRDPANAEGEGMECTLRFDAGTHDILEMEAAWNGFTVLRASITDFTKEMTESDTGDHADLG